MGNMANLQEKIKSVDWINLFFINSLILFSQEFGGDARIMPTLTIKLKALNNQLVIASRYTPDK